MNSEEPGTHDEEQGSGMGKVGIFPLGNSQVGHLSSFG